MTVTELIEHLKTLPQEAHVYVATGYHNLVPEIRVSDNQKCVVFEP